MSMPVAAGGEGFPVPSESDKLLESLREGVLNRAFEKFDEAHLREQEDRRIYLQEAPVETPLDEVMALMLTKDGVRPFQEEKDTKEQLILYISSEFPESIMIEHVRDGIRSKLSLDRYDMGPVFEIEEMFASDTEIDATPDDIRTLHTPETQRSEVARLSSLREKIDRFLITPQD